MHLNINRKNILLASILFVLIAAVLALNQAGLFKNKQTNPLPPKYTKTDLPTDKLPEAFPKDLIQEKDPVILESYQAEIEGNKTQYSVKYLSKNGLETNKQLYTKYLFNINRWIALDKTSDAKSFYIRAGKGMDTIYISFNEPNLMEVVLVRLNVKDLIFFDNNPNSE